MQQIMYEQTPWVVLTYPQYLQAYNTEKWTGWTQMIDGKGPAFFTTGNVSSYLNLQPVKAETGEQRHTEPWVAWSRSCRGGARSSSSGCSPAPAAARRGGLQPHGRWR